MVFAVIGGVVVGLTGLGILVDAVTPTSTRRRR